MVVTASNAKKDRFLLDNTQLITKSYAVLDTSIRIAEMFRLFLVLLLMIETCQRDLSLQFAQCYFSSV